MLLKYILKIGLKMNLCIMFKNIKTMVYIRVSVFNWQNVYDWVQEFNYLIWF